jgi:hypothetical protein
MPEPTDLKIKVTSEDPKKKKEPSDDKAGKGGSSKPKDDPKSGEGEELVSGKSSKTHRVDQRQGP